MGKNKWFGERSQSALSAGARFPRDSTDTIHEIESRKSIKPLPHDEFVHGSDGALGAGREGLPTYFPYVVTTLQHAGHSYYLETFPLEQETASTARLLPPSLEDAANSRSHGDLPRLAETGSPSTADSRPLTLD